MLEEDSSSAAFLQACYRGRACGAVLLGLPGFPALLMRVFFRCDSFYPFQHNPAAQPPKPGMLASFSNPGWAMFVPLAQSAAIYA